MKNTSKLIALATMLSLLLPSGFALAQSNRDKNNNGLHLGELKNKITKEIKIENRLLKKQFKTVNGTVTSMSSSTITIAGENGMAYTIDASKAKIIGRFGLPLTLGEIKINHVLSVYGAIEGTTVSAALIRDESIQIRNENFNGTVVSVTGTSFALDRKSTRLNSSH